MLTQKRLANILIHTIRGSVLFILFLPLVMNSHFFFPFIVVKNGLFRLVVEFIFAAYLVLICLQPEYRPRWNKLVLATVAFFGVSVLAMITGIGWYSSFWGNYERMSGLFHQLHLVLYFIVLLNVFRSKRDWYQFFSFSVFASLLMSFFAFAQWLGAPFLMKSSGGSRLSGTVGNATFLAAYLLFNLFFIAYFWVKEQRFNIKLFALSFLVFDSFFVLAGILSKIFSLADWGIFNFFKISVLLEVLDYPKLFYPFLAMQILIFTAWFLRRRKYSIKILLTVILLFEFIIFFNTQTRGAILGLVASIFVLSLVSLFLPLSRKFKVGSAATLLLIIVLPFVLVAAKNTPVVVNTATLNRLASISFSDITSESRLLTWQTSWRGWTENAKSFLIGYGPENYYYVFNKYFPVKIFKDAGSQIWFDRAHNIIFDVGVTTGLIGLLAYGSMLGFAVWSLASVYKNNHSFSSSWLFVGLIIAYFSQNFFVFDTLNTEILFYLFLAFVAFVQFSAGSESEPEENSQPASSKPKPYYLMAIAVLILVSGLFINVKTLKANNYIYKALAEAKDPTEAYDYYQRSINSSIVGKFEIRQQLANLALNVMRDTNVTPSQKVEIVDRALVESEKSVAEEPFNVRHYIWLASLYNETAAADINNLDKAIDVSNRAIALSPDRPQIYFELGQAYLFKGETDKAIEYFQLGVDKAPWVAESHLTLISVAILAQREDLVKQEFEKMAAGGQKLTAENYRSMINLYLRVKNYSRAIELQLKINELEPGQPDNYFALANLYAQAGDNQRARQAALKVLDLDPKAKSEVDSFLERLD